MLNKVNSISLVFTIFCFSLSAPGAQLSNAHSSQKSQPVNVVRFDTTTQTKPQDIEMAVSAFPPALRGEYFKAMMSVQDFSCALQEFFNDLHQLSPQHAQHMAELWEQKKGTDLLILEMNERSVQRSIGNICEKHAKEIRRYQEEIAALRAQLAERDASSSDGRVHSVI